MAVYQLANHYVIADLQTDQRWGLEANQGTVEFWLRGSQACWVFVGQGDEVKGAMPHVSVSGIWLLGRGYEQRYWEGEIVIEGASEIGR
jgi:hypothetical protein